jgi:hypothetical protein
MYIKTETGKSRQVLFLNLRSVKERGVFSKGQLLRVKLEPAGKAELLISTTCP